MDKQQMLNREIEMRENIDKTIELVCKKLQEEQHVLRPNDYADIVKALAALITARAACSGVNKLIML